MSLKNRMLFAAGSIGTIRPLLLGSLNIGDKIYSDKGLKAVIREYKALYYVVDILEGAAFQEQHNEELKFNQHMERYEVYGNNLTKWRREEQGTSQPGRHVI